MSVIGRFLLRLPELELELEGAGVGKVAVVEASPRV